MPVTPTDDLLERLKDSKYAKLYGEESAKSDFAITLTKARKSQNLTQRTLADKIGISQPYVAKLEGGEANPTLGTIGRLLAAINLRLVTGTVSLKPEPVPPYQGLVFLGAADAVTYPYSSGDIYAQGSWASIWEYPPETINTGAMAGTIIPNLERSKSRYAFVGGAAR